MSMIDFLIRSPRHAIWIKLYLNLIQWCGWATLVMVFFLRIWKLGWQCWECKCMDGWEGLLGGNLGVSVSLKWSLLIFGWSSLPWQGKFVKTLVKRETKRRQEGGVKRRGVTYVSVILLERGGLGGWQGRQGKIWYSLVVLFLGKDVFVKPSSIGKSNGADRA